MRRSYVCIGAELANSTTAPFTDVSSPWQTWLAIPFSDEARDPYIWLGVTSMFEGNRARTTRNNKLLSEIWRFRCRMQRSCFGPDSQCSLLSALLRTVIACFDLTDRLRKSPTSAVTLCGLPSSEDFLLMHGNARPCSHDNGARCRWTNRRCHAPPKNREICFLMTWYEIETSWLAAKTYCLFLVTDFQTRDRATRARHFECSSACLHGWLVWYDSWQNAVWVCWWTLNSLIPSSGQRTVNQA